MRHVIRVSVWLGLFLGGARAQTVDPALMQQLHWRMLGPFRGGRVLAVTGVSDDANRFYFGSVNGGVWRSDDAGRTWQPISDAIGIGTIGAIAIAPSAEDVIYVGTGEADMRSDIAQGRGVFRSADAGRTWHPVGLEDTQQIGKILVDPTDPNTVLVAALGHPYGSNPQRGVFRSTDGGQHWTRTLFRDADTGAIDLTFAPGSPKIVYAALWQTRRPPWNVYPPSNGPGSGLYRSTDGGQTWARLAGHGLPNGFGRIGLATSPAAPHRVFALITPSALGDAGGLYRSDDDGMTWRPVSTDTRLTNRGWYFSGVTADPADANHVYVCNTVMLESHDGGQHFAPILGDPTGDDFHSLWIDPSHPARRMLGVDQGALVSVNGGKTWSSWYNQPTGQFYHVTTDNRFPYRVYGAQQDSGAAAVDSRGGQPMDGISLMQFHETAAGGESDNIAPDPRDPDMVYGGRVDVLNLHDNEMRDIDPTLAFPGNYRGTWTLPLVFGPGHDLYFGNQRIFATRDGGAHWRPISPDLTRATLVVPATLDGPAKADLGGPGAASGPRRGVVYSIGPSPLVPGLLWAGTDDGLVWVTRTGGTTWRNVTPPGLGAWSKIGVVEPSHFDRRTAYIAVDRHRLDDPHPYVFATHDSGKTWTEIDHGLPDGPFPASVNVVREDPLRAGLLYAGTEHGAYVSFDEGGHWQALGAGLPPTSVRDITVHGDDIVIATHGRGFYVLDDMTALRALARNRTAPRPRLYPIAAAVRVDPPAFAGTPLPAEEPAAPEPPAGVIIDYALPPSGARHVTLTIQDASGREIRRFDSARPTRRYDPDTAAVPPLWARPAPVPETGGGAHRFVWNMRRALPSVLSSVTGDDAPRGILVPPGRYRVVLTVDGMVCSAIGDIVPDPRDTATQHHYLASYAFAEAVQKAETMTLAAQRQAPSGEQPAFTELLSRFLAQGKAANSADGAPTPDAVHGYQLAMTELKRLRSARVVPGREAEAKP